MESKEPVELKELVALNGEELLNMDMVIAGAQRVLRSVASISCGFGGRAATDLATAEIRSEEAR